jgi:hypothetical protein
MLKRTMAVGLALVLALTGTAVAQNCSIGVYANADGTGNTVLPTEVQAFNFYVVVFTENVVNAAAYSLVNPDPANFFTIGSVYGPSGNGISITTPGGENVGLGECAIGVGGLPVLVTCYTALVTSSFAGGSVCVVANTDQDPSTNPNEPQVNLCTDDLMECVSGNCLLVEPPIATEAASFGAIKALY